jgi:phospholipase/lecithinase/hemolysin
MQRSIIFTLLAGLIVALGSLPGQADCGQGRPFDEIIVFGASMSDAGNAHILTNGAAGAEPYWGGRISNGPVWVEYLSDNLHLGKPKEDAPAPEVSLRGGTNYAVGGASSGWGVSTSGAPSIGLQIDFFFQDGRTLDGDELIVIQGGGNDSSPTYAASAIGEHIAELAEAGGRYFLIANQPRTSQRPGIKGRKSFDIYVESFDEALGEVLDELEADLPISIYRLDLLALTDDIIANPSDYGLTNITDKACPGCNGGFPTEGAEHTVVSNPDEYLYWDGVHYTTVVHEIFAEVSDALVRD